MVTLLFPKFYVAKWGNIYLDYSIYAIYCQEAEIPSSPSIVMNYTMRLERLGYLVRLNSCEVLLVVTLATSASGNSSLVASQSATSATKLGSFVLPLCGTGAKKGASVSSMIRSKGGVGRVE